MSHHKIIHFVRHGHVVGNDRHAFVGCHSDLALSEKGFDEISELKKTIFKSITPKKTFCSPLRRTQQTAKILNPSIRKIVTLVDLKEVDFGDWEGLTYEGASTRDPELMSLWEKNIPKFRFPNGESMTHFYERVVRVADELVSSEESEILVISHGGMIRSLICQFLDLPLSKNYLFKVSTASLSSVEVWGDRGNLIRLNSKPYTC
jgi:broad specificity phosphatase PhoE